MHLRRIKPVMVKRHPPLTPIEPSPEEMAKGRERARRIARGRK